MTTVVAFAYDHRKRLIGETRTIDADPDVEVYSFTYAYDPLGNRTKKTDVRTGDYVAYFYDVTDPDPEFPTRNNRLRGYHEWKHLGDAEYRRTRKVEYIYWKSGATGSPRPPARRIRPAPPRGHSP